MALRVLMLGWEFPPEISGGLGVACKQIAEKLAAQCDLTVVVPFSSKVSTKPEAYKLVGFDEPVSFTRETTFAGQSWSKKVIEVPTGISSAYSHSYSSSVEVDTVSKQPIVVKEDVVSSRLYSDRLFDQIQEYTQDVLRYINPSDFDVVYAHDWMTFLAAIELKKTGLKFAAHVHSLTYDRVGEEDKGWIFQIEKMGMSIADTVIAVSNYTGRLCAQNYDVDYKKIEVVHNAFDFSKNDRLNSKNSKHVAFIGRLTYQKAPTNFIEIANKLLKVDKQFTFTVIGDGDEYHFLKDQVSKIGISENVKFLGFVEHSKIKEALTDAAVYCMPSISEPFGLTALEAVQYGLVPVISRQSGASEVLKSAVTVDYWDIDGFVKGIIESSTDLSKSSNTLQRCQSELASSSWRKTADKIYNTLLSL